MAHVIADNVQVQAASAGTEHFAIYGVMPGYSGFADYMADGDTTWYGARVGDQREVGVGTIRDGGATLERTRVLSSSSGGALVDFASPPIVYCTVPAEALRPLIGHREVLTDDRTYYVRTDGDDGNDGLEDTSGGAFLTLQRAADAIERLDLNGHNVTVHVADGTYTAGVVLPELVGKGTIAFIGNAASPASVLLHVTGGNCFVADKRRTYHVNGFTLQTTSAGRGLYVFDGARLEFSNLEFGACANGHIEVSNAKVVALTDYKISGGGTSHAAIVDRGSLIASGKTVTITGTPAFSLAFVYMRGCSNYEPYGSTFSGSATGQRYSVNGSSSIFVNGAGTSFLPGNSAGYLASGCSYA